jgi:diguanylate cyclase (GGDEF)-like protein/PAS domain S-box-containing protein
MTDSVLLVEGDPAEAQALIAALADPRSGPCTVHWVTSLAEGLERLKSDGISVVLLDLFLSDSQGIETFDKLLRAAPRVPILILSALVDEDMARQAVRRGAKDYLLKGNLGTYSLPQTLRNIVERSSLEESAFVEMERSRVTLDSIGDAVLSIDMTGTVTYLNRVAEHLTGWPQREAVGQPLAQIFQIIDGVTREPAPDPMATAIQQHRTVSLTRNCVLIRRDGQESAIEDATAPICDSAGETTGAVIVFRDIDAARASALEMSRLAQHDPLTDLPNRSLLTQRLTQAIVLAARHHRNLALLFIDLDHFKNVNDTLGHATGDKLLQSVAERLANSVRKSDTVSRQGGDEFVVLLSEIERKEDAALAAENLITAVTAMYPIALHELAITASIGISIYPDDGEDAQTLLMAADTAMYHAKDHGRNRCQLFSKDMKARAIERQSLEDDIRAALRRQEFVLHYQAQIDLETGAIIGTEALIRWHHPTRGLLFPGQFISVAEECGLIVPIGQWVLREACRQTRAWLDAGLRPMHVAVNISALEFRNRHFLEGVRSILEDTGLEPSYLELEVTESVLMHDAKATALMLEGLKAMGVQLAIDDFGTGYSSLSYLTRFQIDALKIDQSFVQAITPDPGSIVLGAVIGMAKSLKHRVIAEGVETPHQLASLQAMHCGEGQGFLFHRPSDAKGFVDFLTTGISEEIHFPRRPEISAAPSRRARRRAA